MEPAPHAYSSIRIPTYLPTHLPRYATVLDIRKHPGLHTCIHPSESQTAAERAQATAARLSVQNLGSTAVSTGVRLSSLSAHHGRLWHGVDRPIAGVLCLFYLLLRACLES